MRYFAGFQNDTTLCYVQYPSTLGTVTKSFQKYILVIWGEKFLRQHSGQSISLLSHLKQGLLLWNSQLQCFLQ